MPAPFSEEDLVPGTLPGPPLCDSGPAARAGGRVIRTKRPSKSSHSPPNNLRKYVLRYFPFNRREARGTGRLGACWRSRGGARTCLRTAGLQSPRVPGGKGTGLLLGSQLSPIVGTLLSSLGFLFRRMDLQPAPPIFFLTKDRRPWNFRDAGTSSPPDCADPYPQPLSGVPNPALGLRSPSSVRRGEFCGY